MHSVAQESASVVADFLSFSFAVGHSACAGVVEGFVFVVHAVGAIP